MDHLQANKGNSSLIKTLAIFDALGRPYILVFLGTLFFPLGYIFLIILSDRVKRSRTLDSKKAQKEQFINSLYGYLGILLDVVLVPLIIIILLGDQVTSTTQGSFSIRCLSILVLTLTAQTSKMNSIIFEQGFIILICASRISSEAVYVAGALLCLYWFVTSTNHFIQVVYAQLLLTFIIFLLVSSTNEQI